MQDSNNQYNLRQYELMLRSIQGYQPGLANLGRVVSDLEALNSALQEPSEEWLNGFQSSWWPLEEVYALALSEKRHQLDVPAENVVRASLNRLASLIKSEESKKRVISP